MDRFRGLIAICAFVLGCAVGAEAQSDVMCICTDAGSSSTCGGNVDVGAFGQVTLYFGILNPSEPQVAAWEAFLDIDGESSMIGTWTVLGEASYLLSTPPEFLVGAGSSPIQPNSGNMIPLLSFAATILDESPIRFFIRPIPGSLSFPDAPGYAPEAGVAIPCTSCAVGGLPAFSINFEPETQSWGEVKDLYDQ
jgi:hypothetical protein